MDDIRNTSIIRSNGSKASFERPGITNCPHTICVVDEVDVKHHNSAPTAHRHERRERIIFSYSATLFQTSYSNINCTGPIGTVRFQGQRKLSLPHVPDPGFNGPASRNAFTCSTPRHSLVSSSEKGLRHRHSPPDEMRDSLPRRSASRSPSFTKRPRCS